MRKVTIQCGIGCIDSAFGLLHMLTIISDILITQSFLLNKKRHTYPLYLYLNIYLSTFALKHSTEQTF